LSLNVEEKKAFFGGFSRKKIVVVLSIKRYYISTKIPSGIFQRGFFVE
jgi:hypothetical protein